MNDDEQSLPILRARASRPHRRLTAVSHIYFELACWTGAYPRTPGRGTRECHTGAIDLRPKTSIYSRALTTSYRRGYPNSFNRNAGVFPACSLYCPTARLYFLRSVETRFEAPSI